MEERERKKSDVTIPQTHKPSITFIHKDCGNLRDDFSAFEHSRNVARAVRTGPSYPLLPAPSTFNTIVVFNFRTDKDFSFNQM